MKTKLCVSFLLLSLVFFFALISFGCPVNPTGLTVEAGDNRSVTLGSAVNLAGTCTDATATITWSILSKPTASAAVITTPEALVGAMFTADVAGDYVVQLTGTNGTDSDSDEVTITAQPSSAQLAQQYYDQGMAQLHAQSYDAAFASFSNAVMADPTMTDATYAYNLVNIIMLSVDPDLRTVIGDKLGIVGYPASFNDVITDSWLTGYTSSGGYTELYPEIEGQASFDGVFGNSDDGIDFPERLIAMLAHFVANNDGFNSIIDVLIAEISARTQTITAAAANLPDNFSFTLTWDMFVDAAADWPFTDASSAPQNLVIGKAELLTLAAHLEAILSFLQLADSVQLSVEDIQQYYDFFNPINGTMFTGTPPFNYPDNPLLTLLTPSVESAASMAASRANLYACVDHTRLAIENLLLDRAGLTYSSTGQVLSEDPDWWAEQTNAFQWLLLAKQEILDSLDGKGPAILPYLYAFDFTVDPTSFYPTTAIDEISFAVDFDRFYDLPLSFTNILECENGNPVFYRLNAGTIEAVAAAPDPASAETFALKFLFGNYDLDRGMTLDDPETQFTTPFFNYYDENGNGSWDGPWDGPETIYSFDLSENIEGPIDLSRISEYPDSDPVGYYTIADIASIPPTILEPLIDIAGGTTVADLIAALQNADEPDPSATVYYPGEHGLYPDFLDGQDLYAFDVSSAKVWSSMSPEGTVGLDDEGATVYAAGCYWWTVTFGMLIFNEED